MLAPYAAGWMVFVSTGFALALLWTLTGLPGVGGPAGAVLGLGWFLGALILTARNWPMAFDPPDRPAAIEP